MRLKLSMLTAAAVIAVPIAAGAQSSSVSTAPKAGAQTDVQEGQTPAEAASKKSAKPKASANAKAAPKAEVETYSQDGLSPAQAASKKSARPKADAKADEAAAAAAPPAPESAPAPATKPAPQATAPGQAGTTPGLEQTTPGQASELTPAVTGTTPSGQTNAAGQAVAGAKASAKVDVKAGATVFDSSGNSVGTISSIDGKMAVLNTGKVSVRVPVSSLAQGDKGLTIGMSRTAIEAQAKGKTK